MTANPKLIDTVQAMGPALAPVLKRIDSETEYQEKLSLCEWLMQTVNNEPSHLLGPILDALADRIAEYEENHLAPLGQSADPIATTRFLMDQHHLKLKDLTDVFGSVSIASEVLAGKRQLNKGHIERLSKRFHVSPAVFF